MMNEKMRNCITKSFMAMLNTLEEGKEEAQRSNDFETAYAITDWIRHYHSMMTYYNITMEENEWEEHA